MPNTVVIETVHWTCDKGCCHEDYYNSYVNNALTGSSYFYTEDDAYASAFKYLEKNNMLMSGIVIEHTEGVVNAIRKDTSTV